MKLSVERASKVQLIRESTVTLPTVTCLIPSLVELIY